MIDTKALRDKILVLAMRGKLVPQNPNDEPASELLKRIKAEKEELIQQKKIKHDRNETEISRGTDGLYYEKFLDGTIKEVEVPYDLPEGWEWARINSIYWNLGQKKPKTQFYYLDTGAVNNSIQQLDFSKIEFIEANEAPSRARKIVQKNSVIFSTVRSYLKNMAIVDVDEPQNYIASTAFIVLDSLFDTTFLLNLLLSTVFLSQVEKKSTGSNYPAINEKNFNVLFVPVPPKSEQERIGDKMRYLLDKVEQIEKEQQELQQLADQLKKKVLDVAMKGNLVPQDPDDEPASVLLEKIRAEKQKLYEEGKLKKKDLVETEIIKGEDNVYYEKFIDGTLKVVEVPFSIPDNWLWTRLNSYMDVRDGTHDTPKYVDKGYRFITSKNLNGRTIDFKNVNYISKADCIKFNQRSEVAEGDILMAMIGTIGNPVVAPKVDFEYSIKNIALFKRLMRNQNSFFIRDYLEYVEDRLKAGASGGNQKFLSLKKLKEVLIPIPPLTEQNRIIDKISELMDSIDSVSTR